MAQFIPATSGKAHETPLVPAFSTSDQSYVGVIPATSDKPNVAIPATSDKPHVPKYDWYTWLSGNPQHILHHVARFAASDLREDDIPYFSHDLLSSIGIDSAHDRLEILRHRDTYLARKVDLAERLSEKSRTIVYGLSIKCESDVRVRVGPIIGKVTSTTAIVMIEVSLHRNLVAHLIPFDSKYPIRSKATAAKKNRPKAFLIENLVPGMKYNVVFEGINAKDAHNKTGVVKTMQEGNGDVRIVALSCDSPDRLKDGETNMWNKLADQVKADEVDVVLHLGDQVYAWKEFQDAQAILRYSGHPRGTESVTSKEVEIRHLQKAIKDRLRDIYRFTWNLPGTATVLSNCSNLMIWSDNDLINDFTVAKEEGEDGIEPLMLYLAHQVYREYQRQLWDINYETEQHTDEFHYHKFGHTGIFINDIRGNRITNKGEQRPNNPLVNEKQWTAINHALSDPTLKNLLVCCEIPYLGNSPEEAKAQAAKLIFLADHWSYNDSELVRLLETVFEWREAKKGKRAAVLIGGDIHVGVYTTVKDSKTNSEMLQLTTTPISNGVSNFYPALEGKINDRFSYKHVPELKKRNYAYVTTHVEGKQAIIDAKLIVGAPVK